MIEGVTQIDSEAKGKRVGILGLLFTTLGESLLGNILASKGVIRAGDEVTRAGQEF